VLKKYIEREKGKFMEDRKVGIFSKGSCWIRADFHLHTNADKEFNYKGDIDYYYSNYVKGLEDAGITLGVITNHNKFDNREFKALQKEIVNIMEGGGEAFLKRKRRYEVWNPQN